MHSAEGGARGGKDAIESRIDAALASYAEPPAMPDSRVAAAQVMARLAAAREVPRRRWWLWAAPAAACLLMVLAVGVGRMTRAPGRPQIASAAPSVPVHEAVRGPVREPVPSPIENGKVSAPVRRPGRRVSRPAALAAREQPLPKLDVFPTPAPLSAQEEALVAFAKHGPAAVQHAVLEDQKHWDDPIIVAELQEKPLRAGSQQNQ